MTAAEPPAGSEHYREGWRNGYEQARIDRERAADDAAPLHFPTNADRVAANKIAAALIARFGWLPLSVRYGAARDAIRVGQRWHDEHPDAAATARAEPVDTRSVTVPFPGKRYARIELPQPLTAEDWAHMHTVLEAMWPGLISDPSSPAPARTDQEPHHER